MRFRLDGQAVAAQKQMPNDIKHARSSAPRSAGDGPTNPGFEPARDVPAVVVGLFTIMLGAGGEPVRALLRFDRTAILQDLELWRLLSGHFVHLGWSHLLLNLAGCLLVWYLFRREFGLKQWALMTVTGALAISAGFLLFYPMLDWYVGLSGLLHGLFAAGLVSWIRERSLEAFAIFAVFAGKILWEQIAGPLPLTSNAAGGPVIVAAHLYGAVAGGFVASVLLLAGRSGSRV